MPDSFAGVSFSTIVQDEWFPGWSRKPSVIITHVPASNQDDIQFGGLGNQTQTVEVLLDSATADVDIDTLQAALDGTARTLVLFGSSYTNTYLIDMGTPHRVQGTERWRTSLTFMRVAA